MLADLLIRNTQTGALDKEVQLTATSMNELLDFIADQLPLWRDDPNRSRQTSETQLTSQLCSHLNTAARLSKGWDILQFKTEVPDARQLSRTIDLVASPCGSTVWVNGRRCTHFDTLIPIECKRLPTPKGKRRDIREYVITEHSTTGGIQRFKAGHHGADHNLAGMIGYLQEESPASWCTCLNAWIEELDADPAHLGWTLSDRLRTDPMDRKPELTVYRSTHTREGLSDIEIRHLWIKM